MNSINHLAECNPLLDKLSYLLMIISFFIGMLFFSKSKHSEQSHRTTNYDEKGLIESETRFFINMPEDVITRKSLF